VLQVYEQFQIEIDQRTGDYAECNPGSKPPHDFSCTHFQHGSSCWYNDKDHPEWATEFADAWYVTLLKFRYNKCTNILI